MATSILEVKIKALVEGLDGLSKLRESLQDVVDFVGDVAVNTKGAIDSLRGLSTTGNEAASGLSSLTSNAKDLGTGLTSVGRGLSDAKEGLGGVAQVADEAADGLRKVSAESRGIEGGLSGIGDAAGIAAESLGEINDQASEGSGSLEGLATSSQAVQQGISDVGDVSGDLVDQLGELAGTGEDATGNLEDLASSSQVVNAGLEDISSATGDVVDQLGGLSGVSEDASGGVEDVGSQAEASSSKFVQLIAKLKDLTTQLLGVGEGTDDFEQETEEAAKGSQGLVQRITQLGSSLEDVGGAIEDGARKLDGLQDETTESVGAVQDLVKGLKPLFAALVAMAGIKISFDYLKEAATYAARVETLGITMNVVGRNTGYTAKELAEYEKGLKKAGISTEGARDAMTQMMNAGLSLGQQTGQTRAQILLMADAAKDLAVVTGENTSETLSRLTTNIQQLDAEGLRFMGLMVDNTAAQQKFADSIGTSVGALTEAQKRQAVLNEVLVQASKMTGAYDAAMESVGKKLSSMTRLQDELSNSIGKKLLPAYGAIVDAASDLLKQLGKQAEEFDKNDAAANSYGKGLKAALEPIVPILSDVFGWLLKAFEMLAPVFEQVMEAVGSVLAIFGDLTGAVGPLTGEFGAFQIACTLLAGAFAAVADGVDFIRIGINGLVALVATALGAVMSKVAMIAEWLPLPQKIVDGVKNARDSLDKLATESGNKADELANKFANGETHLAKWTATLKDGIAASSKFDSTSAQKFGDTITELVRKQTDHVLSSTQVVAETNKIKTALDQALASNQISQKEYDKLSISLSQVSRTIQEELDKAFKLLKTSSTELASGVSEDSSVIIGALKQVAENGNATAQQFANAFGQNIGIAKSVEELAQLSAVLEDAKTRWPQAPQLFAEAQGQVAKNFQEIYTKQLEALSSAAQWDTLKASIIALGKDGTISISQMNLALEQGEKAVNRLSPAFIAAADATTKIETAIKGVEEKITQLREAIEITADKAITAYEGMAEGYSQLSDQVGEDTNRQIEEIERRFERETALIDQTVTDQEEAEEQKLDALLSAEAKKTEISEKGYQKQVEYNQKEAQAQRDALDVRLQTLDTEIAKIEEALGKQGADRAEFNRKLKELEKEREVATQEVENTIKQKRIDSMQIILDRYKAHINALNAEEDRHLEKVKSIEEQKQQAKMSMEERLRALEKQGMSDYEAYQKTMSDVAELQAKAREAASKGEMDAAKEYLSQAKSAATELNTVVKEGEKVYVDKQTALDNTKEALISLGQTEQEILENSQKNEQKLADAAGRAKDKIVETANKTQEQLEQMRAEGAKGVEIVIDAKDDQARARVRELKDLVSKEEMLTKLSLDLKEAKETYEKIKEAIENGTEMPVGVEAERAYESLAKLKEYAKETNNSQLEMDVSAAMAAIDQTKAKVNEISQVKPRTQVDIQINGEDKLASAAEKLRAIDRGEPIRDIVEFQVNNEDKLDQVVYKITKLKDNSVIYTKGTFDVTEAINNGDKLQALYTEIGTKETLKTKAVLETDADEKGEKIDKAMRKRDDVSMTATVNTNAEEQIPKIEDAMRQRDVTDTATIDTNADEAKTKIEGATESVKAESENKIETNADEQKAKIDAALEQKQTESQHNVTTNADEVAAQMKATMEVPTTSQHTVTSDHDAVAGALKAAMEVPSNSQHTVTSDHDAVAPAVKAAMEAPTTSQHTVTSDHDAVAGQMKSAMEAPTTSQHNVDVLIDAAKATLQGLNAEQTKSPHTIDVQIDPAKAAIQALNSEQTTSPHTIDTAGVDVGRTAIQALNSETTKSPHEIDTAGVDAGRANIQTLNNETTKSPHEIDTSGVETGRSDIQSLNSEQTKSTHTIDTSGIETGRGAIQKLNSEQTKSKHTVEVETDKARKEIKALDSEKSKSKHTVEVDREKFDADIESLKETESKSPHKIEVDLEKAQQDIATLNNGNDTKSTHEVDTSQVSQAQSEINGLNSANTQSQHQIMVDTGSALSQIRSLNGANTYSTHTIYVVKEYLFGLGGFFGYAEGGEVGPQGSPGKKTKLYPLQTSGIVPGAANYDSVPRTLPVGAYVLNKGAVQAYGAQPLLEFLEKAKSLPKQVSAAFGQTKAWLMPGEIVVSPDSASRIGTGLLDRINYLYERRGKAMLPHFEHGGPVGKVNDLLRDQLPVGYIGNFYEKGGEVKAASGDTMTVDLRGNMSRATVTVERDNTKNLLEVLKELKDRAA